VNGPKSNNYVLVGIWLIVCVQKTSHHFLQIFRLLCLFKVFCERRFALLRQEPENHIEMSTLAPHGKVPADAHGDECVLLPCLMWYLIFMQL